jgi:lipooligosaccharide transport system ATP-binding protein
VSVNVPHQTTSDPMIAARDLRKSFTGRDGTVVEAVKGIDIDVHRGEAFGFLGPNGAGKSSTMRMIAAVSPVSGGELRILGMNPTEHGPAIRSRLGVCPQEDTLDNELNVFDNLYIYGRYFGIAKREVRERADELLEFVQLTEKRTAKVEDLSGGMKRRLTIARSLINRPDILLLDEPTTGLDPRSRTDVWGMVRELVADGVTVLLTTQYLDEADQLAHDIVVFDHGRVVATGTPDELKAKTGGQVLQVAPADPARMAEVTALMTELIRGEVSTNAETGMAAAPVGDSALVRHVFRELDDRGIELAEFALRRPSMDEVFLTLTGRRASDEDSGARELEGSTR